MQQTKRLKKTFRLKEQQQPVHPNRLTYLLLLTISIVFGVPIIGYPSFSHCTILRNENQNPSKEDIDARTLNRKLKLQLANEKEPYNDFLFNQFLNQSIDDPKKALEVAKELLYVSRATDNQSDQIKANLIIHIASLNLGINSKDLISILNIYNQSHLLDNELEKKEIEWLTARTFLVYGEITLADSIIKASDTTNSKELPRSIYIHQISTMAHCALAQNKLDEASKYADIILRDSFTDENYRTVVLGMMIKGIVTEKRNNRTNAVTYYRKAYEIASYYNDSIYMLTTLLYEPMLFGSKDLVYEIGSYLTDADFSSIPVREMGKKYIQFCLVNNDEQEALRIYSLIVKKASHILPTQIGLEILALLKTSLNKSQNRAMYLDILQKESIALKDNYKIKREILNYLFTYDYSPALNYSLNDTHFWKNLTRLSLVLGLIIIISLFSILYYLSRIRRREAIKKHDITKEQLFRLQMNPHFVFNVLVAIQNSIYNESILETTRLINSFSRLMMAFLHQNETKSITLELEIDTIRQYLFIQSLRFNDQFSYRITIDSRINPSMISIPPMLTQPFIENAIEHGLARSPNPGMIEIFYTLYKKHMLIEIIDNGVGINSTNTAKRGDHMSMARHLTTERIRILNKGSFRKGVKFSIQDIQQYNKNRSGTKVVFMVPFTVILPETKMSFKNE